ncbi:polysaccharide pyruvyl transferase family protein [Flavobacterium saccharophilum]|uniref:Polysaccharide pyruvyl transferase n=1 Tax=Flavobacterium saccharophilum TaxID=29534 RepID=A0A1M7GTN8_9FLAO|nr:polysaccharide pyruvyl transferase family protein [Flavobacterium saccharophilum]SHM19570.1 Polysaccharide pyruvyl transferase [Flavobacterium saccharophilum]
MKVGILTLPLHKNYGGILQAYALQNYLQKNGFEVVLIDRQWNVSFLSLIKKNVKKKLLINSHLVSQEIVKNTTYFIDKYFVPKTEILDSEKKLSKIVTKLNLDAIIVGSDQVWRLEYTGDTAMNFFLDFVKKTKTKKISYAASFGEDVWEHEPEITNEVKSLLNKFVAVSVREDSSIELCKNHFKVDVKHHIDPTMLLTKQDYDKLIAIENEPKSKGNVLIYMLDINSDRKKTIDAVVDRIGGSAFSVNVKSTNINDKVEDRTYPTVTSWLRGFQDAEFVVTDSFHGCVFSIIFNKPFIGYGNVGRGLSRFNSLFRMFGLENRLILKYSDLNQDLILEKIDWNTINSKLELFRKDSLEYFKQNIK